VIGVIGDGDRGRFLVSCSSGTVLGETLVGRFRLVLAFGARSRSGGFKLGTTQRHSARLVLVSRGELAAPRPSPDPTNSPNVKNCLPALRQGHAMS
jgi:hypothetical protein